jgi:hypothetical protein
MYVRICDTSSASLTCDYAKLYASCLHTQNRARLRSGGGAAAAAVLQQHLRPAETPATAAAGNNATSSNAGPNSADDSKGGLWTKVRGAGDRSTSFDRQQQQQQSGASPKGDDKKWSVVPSSRNSVMPPVAAPRDTAERQWR